MVNTHQAFLLMSAKRVNTALNAMTAKHMQSQKIPKAAVTEQMIWQPWWWYWLLHSFPCSACSEGQDAGSTVRLIFCSFFLITFLRTHVLFYGSSAWICWFLCQFVLEKFYLIETAAWTNIWLRCTIFCILQIVWFVLTESSYCIRLHYGIYWNELCKCCPFSCQYILFSNIKIKSWFGKVYVEGGLAIYGLNRRSGEWYVTLKRRSWNLGEGRWRYKSYNHS